MKNELAPQLFVNHISMCVGIKKKTYSLTQTDSIHVFLLCLVHVIIVWPCNLPPPPFFVLIPTDFMCRLCLIGYT